MIFVTVGGQLPFDRLVNAVDSWAAARDPNSVFAQIGDSEGPPPNLRWERFLTRTEFAARMREASVIVSHAGMGTILTAIELQKPILVMPRRAHLREHRNDHQWATVRRLPAHLGVQIARDEEELVRRLQGFPAFPTPRLTDSPEHSKLLEYLSAFVAP